MNNLLRRCLVAAVPVAAMAGPVAAMTGPVSAQVPATDSAWAAAGPVVDSLRSWAGESAITLITAYQVNGLAADVVARIARETGLGLGERPCFESAAGCSEPATLVWLSNPERVGDRVRIDVVAMGTGAGSLLGTSSWTFQYFVLHADSAWVVDEVVLEGIGHGLRRGGGRTVPDGPRLAEAAITHALKAVPGPSRDVWLDTGDGLGRLMRAQTGGWSGLRIRDMAEETGRSVELASRDSVLNCVDAFDCVVAEDRMVVTLAEITDLDEDGTETSVWVRVRWPERPGSRLVGMSYKYLMRRDGAGGWKVAEVLEVTMF